MHRAFLANGMSVRTMPTRPQSLVSSISRAASEIPAIILIGS
jgi:hypothetical protein